jgi:hypothetical protein
MVRADLEVAHLNQTTLAETQIHLIGGLQEATWGKLVHGAQCPGEATLTYVTTEDNEDNGHTGYADGDMGSVPPCISRTDGEHPIEFNIDVPAVPPGLSVAWLSLVAWDVSEENEECPEVDEVYFNENLVGYLRGGPEMFSTSGPYEIDPAWVQVGDNLVEVYVNTTGCVQQGSERWCASVKQGALHLEGGEGTAVKQQWFLSPSDCWSSGSLGYVYVEVDTSLDSQEVMVEINVLDPQGHVLVGYSETKMIHGAEDDAFMPGLLIPSQAQAGLHTVQIIIYDACSGTIQEVNEHFVFINCATATPTPTLTPTVTQTPTQTPTTTPTPTPTTTPASGSISGKVILERRASNAGAIVAVDGLSATTAVDGSFAIANVPPGNHTISVSRMSYLRTWRDVTLTAGETLVLPDVTLLGGDVNQDDRIEAADGVLVSLAWNSTPALAHWDERADITDDNNVNILDMVAVQFNWDRTAPGPW